MRMREEKKVAICRTLVDLYFTRGEETEEMEATEDPAAGYQEVGPLWAEICQCERSIREKLGVEHCEELEQLLRCYSRLCYQASLRLFKCGILIGEEWL